LLRLSK
jgi:hypothetical protein